MSHLQNFISGYAQSRVREHLLSARLIHEVGIAAAARGYELLVYTPTVDSDGFDVILDDQDRLVPIQLKSMHAGGKTADWAIHRSLIRPEPEHAELYGFEPSSTGVGRGGGVVLTKVAAAAGSTVAVTYHYTDIAVLTLKWRGILPLPKPQVTRLARLRGELESNTGGKVRVPRSAFVQCHSPGHLLAWLGLQSEFNSSWRYHLLEVLRAEERQNNPVWREVPRPVDPPELFVKALHEDVQKLLRTPAGSHAPSTTKK